MLLIRNLGITFCKVYITELLRKYKIEFPLGMKLCEDAVFYYRYIRYAKRVVTINKQDYYYYLPSGDTKYNLSINDELCGLNAMQDAIIPILQKYSYSVQVEERLQQRLLIVLLRVFVAIMEQKRRKRSYFYSLIEWEKLLPMTKMNYFFKLLIKFRMYSVFDLCRSIYQKITTKDLFDLLGVEKV